MILYFTSTCISYVNVNAKQACQKRNKSISRMLLGENRPVTSNLAVEVIAGGFNMAMEVVGEILTSKGSVQSHSVRNAVYYVRNYFFFSARMTDRSLVLRINL